MCERPMQVECPVCQGEVGGLFLYCSEKLNFNQYGARGADKYLKLHEEQGKKIG